MAAKTKGKMQNLINFRMRVTLNDGRQMTGQMLAFDKHMNLVLADCEEFRRVRKKAEKEKSAPGSTAAPLLESEEKRTLGLAIVRGAHIISLSVDGPPPADPSARLNAGGPGGLAPGIAAGPGISKPAGRGMPTGLTGPAAGIGGPGPGGFGGGFPGAPPPGFGGRGGPPPGFPPQGFPGAPVGGPPGFPGGPPGFGPPPGQGRGFQPPPGFGGR